MRMKLILTLTLILLVSYHPNIVEIRVEIEGKQVFQSAQREFFAKNGHRGKGPLQKAIEEAMSK